MSCLNKENNGNYFKINEIVDTIIVILLEMWKKFSSSPSLKRHHICGVING
jgi:hypothetical protein